VRDPGRRAVGRARAARAPASQPHALARQVGELAAWLRGSPLAPGATAIHLPGEPERIAARERTRDGIPLPRRTFAALAGCARALGVAAFDEAGGGVPGGARGAP
jgi:LDH2 family malate/lactate/ureidoglycolate dehydrogenase